MLIDKTVYFWRGDLIDLLQFCTAAHLEKVRVLVVLSEDLQLAVPQPTIACDVTIDRSHPAHDRLSQFPNFAANTQSHGAMFAVTDDIDSPSGFLANWCNFARYAKPGVKLAADLTQCSAATAVDFSVALLAIESYLQTGTIEDAIALIDAHAIAMSAIAPAIAMDDRCRYFERFGNIDRMDLSMVSAPDGGADFGGVCLLDRQYSVRVDVDLADLEIEDLESIVSTSVEATCDLILEKPIDRNYVPYVQLINIAILLDRAGVTLDELDLAISEYAAGNARSTEAMRLAAALHRAEAAATERAVAKMRANSRVLGCDRIAIAID